MSNDSAPGSSSSGGDSSGSFGSSDGGSYGSTGGGYGSNDGGYGSNDGGYGSSDGGTSRPADGGYPPYDGSAFGQQVGSGSGPQYGGPSSGGSQYGGSQFQQPYQQGYRQPYQQGYRSIEGDKAAQASLILGIVGLFIAGIILGPLAIWQAKKAEQFGVPATAGKVLGWISTILWGLSLLMGIVFFVIVLASVGASGSFSG